MYVGYDQFGNHYRMQAFPRKELCEQLDCQHVARMYVDRKDGPYHIGYIIAGRWITIYGTEGIVFATPA